MPHEYKKGDRVVILSYSPSPSLMGKEGFDSDLVGKIGTVISEGREGQIPKLYKVKLDDPELRGILGGWLLGAVELKPYRKEVFSDEEMEDIFV